MGTYEKTVVVDGEEFDLFSHSDDDGSTFQLVDKGGQIIGAARGELPDEQMVLAIVRESRRRTR